MRKETPLPADPQKWAVLNRGIGNLLQKQAIEQVYNQDIAFWSTFLTPKISGEWRPILNLKPLNHYIRPRKFRMETLAAVIHELSPVVGSNAGPERCLSSRADSSFGQKMAKFFIQDSAYRFRSLPLGLSTAPGTFTRVIEVIAEHLRRRGMHVFVI